MKIKELAALMGKTREELTEELRENDVIEVKLTERTSKKLREQGNIELI